MIPSNYSSRRNNQRLMQDRASSPSTSSSQSLDQARSASASNSSSRQLMQDRASSSSTSGSRSLDQARSANASNSSSRQQSAANQSTSRASRRTYRSSYPGVTYSQGRWRAMGVVGSFSTQEEAAWALQQVNAEDRSFYQDAVPYMTSPSYVDAAMPDDAGSAGNSGSLDQLGLARRFTGRFDDEYRDQEYGSHSRQ